MSNASAESSREDWGRLRADVSRLVARRLPTRADVEDVAQEVLLRVWKNGGSVRDDERFGAWLARVAYTAAADHMRDRRRFQVARYPAAEEPDDAEGEALPEDDAGPEARTLIAAVLRPFIAACPPLYREALVLSELEELPHAAIAVRLGLSVSAVKSRVQRGREHLRQRLERCCEIALDARGGPMSCEMRPDGVIPPGCRCRTEAAGAPARSPDHATRSAPAR